MSLDGKVVLIPVVARTKFQASACYRGDKAKEEALQAHDLPACFAYQHQEIQQPYIPDPDEVADAAEWEADVEKYVQDLREHADKLARCNACEHLRRCFVLSVGVERYGGGGGLGA